MMVGAEPDEVVRLVLGLGGRLVGVGIAFGVLAALGATRILGSMLYEVSETDPLTFLTIPLVLGVAATLAGHVPARRVSKSDALAALRSE